MNSTEYICGPCCVVRTDMERGSGSVACVSLAPLALHGEHGEWSAPASFCAEVDVAAYMCASVGFYTMCLIFTSLCPQGSSWRAMTTLGFPVSLHRNPLFW